MSWRRFGVILRGLPMESAFHTAVRNATDPATIREVEPTPGVFGPWSQHDLLLADLRDIMARFVWSQGNYQGAPPPPPKPYPRPGVEQPRSISDEAIAYLEYVREHHGAAPPDDWTPAAQ